MAEQSTLVVNNCNRWKSFIVLNGKLFVWSFVPQNNKLVVCIAEICIKVQWDDVRKRKWEIKTTGAILK